MSFKNGFEKVAVSPSWIGKKVGGGLATRAGHAAGSPMHTRAGNISSKLLKGKDLKPNLEKVRSLNKQTLFNPSEAAKQLREVAEHGKE